MTHPPVDLDALAALHKRATNESVLPDGRMIYAWEIVHALPALLAYVRRLEKVAEAARKGPCRHDSSHTGVDGCPTCAALSRLSQEVKGE